MTHTKNLVLGIVLVAWTTSVHAQNWATAMFSDHKHDFGVVARGSKAEFRFKFENKYKEPVHVHSVTTSCKCTTPSVTKDLLQSRETSEIVCKFNTESFVGHRSADVTVRFDKPYWAEVKLRVSGVIRGDIYVDPGIIEFGQVDQSASASKSIRISHQGNANWRIVDVKSTYPFIKVQLKEIFRGQGAVNYEMIAELTEKAEPGYLQNELILYVTQPHTSNRSAGEVRVPITFTANVTSAIEISPSIVKLGPIKPEEAAKTTIVVKSRSPFKITDVVCDDGNFSAKCTESAGGRLHLLELSYQSGATSESEVKNSIKIVTNMKDKPEINVPVEVTFEK